MIAVAIRSVGLVTSLGLSAPATCAALRAGLSNTTPGPLVSVAAVPLAVHRVPLPRPWQERMRLVKMLAPAISESLANIAPPVSAMPLLLCVAESERPGRTQGLDDRLFDELQSELRIEFDAHRSSIFPLGRLGALVALQRARELLLLDPALDGVVIAAADSLITMQTLVAMERSERLLTEDNSNGFIAGEGAGALYIGRVSGRLGELTCTGLGNGTENATLFSTIPLRADGLSSAIAAALSEARRQIQDLDFRLTDLSGEQYFFKEAALAVGRLLRVRKESFDLWHPAEGIGEVGAVAAVAMITVAWTACRKGYAPGSRILLHAGSDQSARAAAVLEYGAFAGKVSIE